MPDDFWSQCFPNLCQYLTHDSWDDGSAREVSTITIKVEDGRVVCSLSDHDARRSLWKSGLKVEEVLEALEASCVDPRADWRPWKAVPGKKRG